MNSKNCSRLAVIVMLMMIVKPAYFAALDIGSPDEGKRTEAQMYFDQIPLAKRNFVIKHYLGEGLRKQSKSSWNSPKIAPEMETIAKEFGVPPPNFTKNLLFWAKDEFGLEDHEVETIVESSKRVCLPSKGCYPDDIGGQCCPF